MSDYVEGDSFNEIIARIYSVVGVKTQIELAEFLGVKQSAISDAKRRQKISSDWLITLLLSKNIHPEWILTGKGPMLLTPPVDRYETAHEFQEHRDAAVAARRLPSRLLTEELLRRIAINTLAPR